MINFKQSCVIYLLINYSAVTYGSFNYAYYAIDHGIAANDTIMVLGTIHALTTVLLGYAFKLLHKGDNNG